MSYKTEQEEFWSSDFGNDYIERNASEPLKLSCENQFKEILSHLPALTSVTEFGSNIGNNIEALHHLRPDTNLTAIEINPKAAEILANKNLCRVINESILEYQPDHQSDLTFTSGVLIHIAPECLPTFYQKLYDCSRRYVLVIEYYNPTPVSIDYRGHSDRLFKRDFAGDLLDRYSDLALRHYGFFYNRDPKYPLGSNTNWFLLEKTSKQ